jgi:hypothetical protein
MPSRLPRLSVLAAGNLVALMTGSLAQQRADEEENGGDGGAGEDAEVRASLEKAAELARTVQEHARAGAKLVDPRSGTAVGTVVTPPLPGTNLVLGMMRLEPLGLLQPPSGPPSCWSNTNKVVLVNESDQDGEGEGETTTSRELRYLPYLPLWWPLRMDSHTGKANEDQEDPDSEEEGYEDEGGDSKGAAGGSPHLSRIVIEQVDEGSTQR